MAKTPHRTMSQRVSICIDPGCRFKGPNWTPARKEVPAHEEMCFRREIGAEIPQNALIMQRRSPFYPPSLPKSRASSLRILASKDNVPRRRLQSRLAATGRNPDVPLSPSPPSAPHAEEHCAAMRLEACGSVSFETRCALLRMRPKNLFSQRAYAAQLSRVSDGFASTEAFPFCFPQ